MINKRYRVKHIDGQINNMVYELMTEILEFFSYIYIFEQETMNIYRFDEIHINEIEIDYEGPLFKKTSANHEI